VPVRASKLCLRVYTCHDKSDLAYPSIFEPYVFAKQEKQKATACLWNTQLLLQQSALIKPEKVVNFGVKLGSNFVQLPHSSIFRLVSLVKSGRFRHGGPGASR